MPVALLTAVYLAFSLPKGLYRVLKPAVELLAGIPSVVYGFFGIAVRWRPRCARSAKDGHGSGNAMLTASILLAIMHLLIIIGVVERAVGACADELLRRVRWRWARRTSAACIPPSCLPRRAVISLAGIVLALGAHWA